MLTSLFGDLASLRDAAKRDAALGDEPDAGFAATTILESVATEVNERGQMVDRHLRDLVVTGSPAQAIRDHFASTRADLEVASRQITLLDPAGVWASAVVKALSDAGGQPVERLHLREHTTLRTLAMIERTTLVRRHDDALKIYHADVRAPGRDTAEIPVALMERSHMTAVIIGPLAPHAIDALLSSVHEATRLPTWRCPNLLFMLPPNAIWIANKIHAIGWPVRLHVHVIDEPMISSSAVWNALLGIWNLAKDRPVWETAQPHAEFPIKVADLGALPAPAPTAIAPDAPATNQPRPPLDPARVHSALIGMLPLEGLLGCAAVDATTGLVLAREQREDQPIDMDVAAAAGAQVLQAHRAATRSLLGLGEHVEEVTSSSGARQQVLRVLTRYPQVFILAVLDRQRTNLPLARYKLMELDKTLV
jgi:hypothetical protein